MKLYLLTAMACITFLAAILIHERREDERVRKFCNQMDLGLSGIEWSIRP